MDFVEESMQCKNGRADVDNCESPISKRFKKNSICQRKPDAFRKIDRNGRNNSHGIGQTDTRTELRLLRLREKNVSISHEFNENRYKGELLNKTYGFRLNEDRNCPMTSKKCEKRSIMNEDWGKRTELHDVFHVKDGDKMWIIIRRGLFHDIKLWKNRYGLINCKATCKISVKGSTEMSIIEINTEDNLRKLLNLSLIQWSSLCEAVDEKNVALSFNAFEDVSMNKLCFLNKLWFFICKRRHFLSNVCVMGKLSGAVKLMKELQIVPKIVVTEIRDFKGEG